MSQSKSILVIDPNDNEPTEICMTEDNKVSFTTLENAFPRAYGLKYKNPDTGHKRVVERDESRKNFVAPTGGWENKIFELMIRKEAKIQPKVVEESAPLSKEEVEKQKIKHFFKYLYYFVEGGVRFPVTIVTKNMAVTANHCIPPNKNQGDNMQIFDQGNELYTVSIFLRNAKNDFALFRLNGNEFPVKPLPTEFPSVGTSYFALGYPLESGTNRQFVKSPSTVKGVIMTGIIQENNCVYGDSGGSPGFSGGPVISLIYPRGLLGIVLGGRQRPQIIPIATLVPDLIDLCGEAPRVKILPANIFQYAAEQQDMKADAGNVGKPDAVNLEKPEAGNFGKPPLKRSCTSPEVDKIDTED